MRKVLTILSLFFIIITVSGVMLVPWLASATLKTKLVDRLATNDVQVEMSSSPSFALGLGQIDTLHVIAHQAKAGDVRLSEVTLDGEQIFVDMPALLLHDDGKLRRADSLTMRGVISQDNLREVLASKADKLENVQVTIQPDTVLITGQTKILGRMADVELEGRVVGDRGGIYFDMTRLAVKNARIGTAKLGDMFGNITLVKADKIPLGMRIEDVQQRDGSIVVTAKRPQQE